MPIFTLIGLILSVIKIAMDIAAYLRAHPETTAETKAALDRAHFTLGEVHADLKAYDPTKDFQGP
jgi:hypothetical protein